MHDHKTRLKQLLSDLDTFAVFDPCGELVLINADEHERMLERADGLIVRDSRKPSTLIHLPIV